MRFSLFQGSVYYPSFGANKGNRLLLEDLASRGHDCSSISLFSGLQTKTSIEDLTKAGARVIQIDREHISFILNGVEVHATLSTSLLVDRLRMHYDAFQPDWIIVSSEDIGNRLLSHALSIAPEKIIYLARTTQLLPFGPSSFCSSKAAHQMLANVRSIVTISRFVQGYVEDYGGLRSTVLQLPSFDHGPVRRRDPARDGQVLMVNPCGVKGIAIFLDVARSLSSQQFAAVPTWGTTSADIVDMRDTGNINILPPFTETDDLFDLSRLVLVPSLWDEAFAKIVIEAMARGVPVIGSDTGGIPESKLGVDYVLPVQRITQYRNETDEQMIPLAIIPKQNTEPWIRTTERLLQDQDSYLRIADQSAEAAKHYIENATGENLLSYLATL